MQSRPNVTAVDEFPIYDLSKPLPCGIRAKVDDTMPDNVVELRNAKDETLVRIVNIGNQCQQP